MAEVLPTQPPVMLTIGDGTGNGSVLVPKTVTKLTLDGKLIDKIEIKGYDSAHIAPGTNSARLAKKQTDEKTGVITFKELSYDPGGSVRQEDVDGILVRQKDGTDKFFSMSEFTVEAEPAPTSASAPEPASDSKIHSGKSAIDTQLDAIEVRIDRAQMGEATVEWMTQKNIVGTLFTNEASASTAVAAALSLLSTRA